MNPLRRLRPIGRNRHRLPFLGAALVVLTLASMMLGASIARQMVKRDIAPTESSVFGVAQVEVEFLKFDRALRAAAEGSGDLSELRRWYDILYSRVMLPDSVRTLQHFVDVPGFRGAFFELRAFLEQALPLIDAGDAELRAGLPALLAQTEAVEPLVRESTISGVSTAVLESSAKRDRLSASMQATAIFLVASVAGLVGLAGSLLALFRVTENRAAKIESQASQMRTIVETSLDAIFVLDRRGRIKMINEVAQALFGLDPDEVAGRDMATLLFQEDETRARLAFLSEDRRPAPDERWMEATARAADGQLIDIEISVDRSGMDRGWAQVAFLRDISQRRSTEAALREARDRALAGEKAKAEFLAIMSHEMRTPLNGMLGALDLLRDTPLSPRQRALVDTFDRSGDLMLGLVNDVLDLAKFESGKIVSVPRAFVPAELVEGVVGSLQALADADGLALTWSAAPDLPPRVVSAPRMLRHVLLNLVGNAIKFTPAGHIDVSLRMERDDTLAIEVTDTGIGIAKEDCDRIFGDFETADPSYTRRHPGTGLGLGIARRLVRLLGGSMGVTSTQSVGSTFWLNIPVTLPSEQDLPAEGELTHAVTLPRMRILLVEDNAINRLIARDFLIAGGHDVVEATNGAEGVACAGKETFDAILMDISMPVMDGPTATQRIRSGGGPSATAPIIGVTAHAMPGEVEAFLAAGMDACVAKPLDRCALFAALSNAVESRRPLAEQTRGTSRIEILIETLGPVRAAELAAEMSFQMERDLPALSDATRPVEMRGRLAHDLAGTAAGFGLIDLHAALCEIDRAARLGGVLPDELLAELPELWAADRRAIERHLPCAA